MFPFIDKPSAPRDLQVTDTGPGTISLTWSAPATDGGAVITDYIIETREVLGTTFKVASNVDGITMKHTLTGLQDKGEYYIRVRAKNAAGVSKDSAETDTPVTARTPISEYSTLPSTS